MSKMNASLLLLIIQYQGNCKLIRNCIHTCTYFSSIPCENMERYCQIVQGHLTNQGRLFVHNPDPDALLTLWKRHPNIIIATIAIMCTLVLLVFFLFTITCIKRNRKIKRQDEYKVGLLYL